MIGSSSVGMSCTIFDGLCMLKGKGKEEPSLAMTLPYKAKQNATRLVYYCHVELGMGDPFKIMYFRKCIPRALVSA